MGIGFTTQFQDQMLLPVEFPRNAIAPAGARRGVVPPAFRGNAIGALFSRRFIPLGPGSLPRTENLVELGRVDHLDKGPRGCPCRPVRECLRLNVRTHSGRKLILQIDVVALENLI